MFFIKVFKNMFFMFFFIFFMFLCFFNVVFLRLAERVTDIGYTEATVDWEEWESVRQ